MRKIPTIFDRDWDGDGKVLNVVSPAMEPYYIHFFSESNFHSAFKPATATEKLDGMSVRVTVRNRVAVRVEKRRNPDKVQEKSGIVEPWYTDACEGAKEDVHIYRALRGTDLSSVPDGEWSGEAIGENVQGNPLGLEGNRIVFFSLGQAPVLEGVPTDYEGLKAWLPTKMSALNPEKPIEGVVWHFGDGRMCKIKAKDFKY